LGDLEKQMIDGSIGKLKPAVPALKFEPSKGLQAKLMLTNGWRASARPRGYAK
jgi:hypothetical protein